MWVFSEIMCLAWRKIASLTKSVISLEKPNLLKKVTKTSRSSCVHELNHITELCLKNWQ